MSVLKGFLQPSPKGEKKEVIISKRFKGEDGKPLPFTIQTIDQDTNERLINMSTDRKKHKGSVEEKFDHEKYGKRLIAECTVEPNFKDSEMCSYYGVVDPLEVPGRMLSVGEYKKLVDEINELNGFVDAEDIEDEAKN